MKTNNNNKLPWMLCAFLAIAFSLYFGITQWNKASQMTRENVAAVQPETIVGQPKVPESRVQASVMLATNLPEDVTLVPPSNVVKKVSFRVEPKMSLTATQQQQPNNQQ